MHPSPAALLTMSTPDLETYARELAVLSEEHPDANNAYGSRKDLVIAVILDRKRNGNAPLQ